MRHIAIAIALVLGLAAPADAETRAHWQPPRCGVVDGDGAISFTRDAGRTITPTTNDPRPLQYVFGVVPQAKANTLLAVDSRGTVQTSADAGCSWRVLGRVTGLDVPRLTAGPGAEAYVWDQNGPALYRVDGTAVTALPPVDDTGAGVAALAVDPYLPRHVRVVLTDGTVRDSHDAGRSFRTTAAPVRPDLFVYSAAIDPLNPWHITIGTMSEGVYTTWTGGRQWRQASLGARVNAFSVAMSPTNPLVVWVQGIDLAENAAGVPSEGRHIYRSTDGGRTFRVAVDHKPGQVTLVNGTLLAPGPDPNVLYFVFGTSFANYGTDLFRYDAHRDRLSLWHNDYDGIKSIAFNPRDPRVMYLGFAVERAGG
ncbi:hypothetical protein [Actinophytocola sp.]|uniref:WD40/YVTN/BNR-like repeat-containing protein n=1 Tax=Actinophytocola sp. TaxID=1872138 RepID=UPI002ED2506E